MKAEQPERLFFAKFIYLLNLPSYFCRAENKSAILIQNNRLFIHNYGITELVIIQFLFDSESELYDRSGSRNYHGMVNTQRSLLAAN